MAETFTSAIISFIVKVVDISSELTLNGKSRSVRNVVQEIWRAVQVVLVMEHAVINGIETIVKGGKDARW